MDNLSKAERSNRMSRIRGKNTKPELLVRSMVHRMGFRFRLHRADLPGKPDLVFVSRRKVLFVHGCFWHRHKNCKKATTPASNTEYWFPKFDKTVERDRRALYCLRKHGWRPLVVWECESNDMAILARKLRAFLSD